MLKSSKTERKCLEILINIEKNEILFGFFIYFLYICILNYLLLLTKFN